MDGRAQRWSLPHEDHESLVFESRTTSNGEAPLLATRYHPAPLKEMARLRFREMTDADRKAYADVADQHALIASCGPQTWIIEGDMLRIIEIQRGRTQADQQYFALEPWSTSLTAS
jgi:hypothetical protein